MFWQTFEILNFDFVCAYIWRLIMYPIAFHLGSNNLQFVIQNAHIIKVHHISIYFHEIPKLEFLANLSNCKLCHSRAAEHPRVLGIRHFQFVNMRWWIRNFNAWWRHQMETFSVLPAISARNSPVTGDFPGRRPVALNFDAFFDRCLNKKLSKQTWDWWFETPSRPLWRH